MLTCGGQREAVHTWAGTRGGGHPRLRRGAKSWCREEGTHPPGREQAAQRWQTPVVLGFHSLALCYVSKEVLPFGICFQGIHLSVEF